MPAKRERQDSGAMVEVRTLLPVPARDELDRRAALEGMRRATYLRRLVLRDQRNGSSA